MNATLNRPAPPTVTVENVNLERFEALVYSRKHEEAGRELLSALKRLKMGGEFAGHPTTDEARLRLCTRMAAAIGALFADPGFQLSQEGFDLLAVEHAIFHSVFQSSGFGNADHVLRQFATVDANDGRSLHFSTPQDIVKMLVAYSLDSDLDIDFEAAFRTAPRLALPAFLGMLANIVVLSPRAHARRERLLQLGALFEQVDVHEYMLPALSDAYMYCSYASADNKHAIKRSFNSLMRRLVEPKIQAPSLPKVRQLKSRPTIVVPVEWFTSLHAMYRCYAPSIGKLRERFRLVMVGRESEMDGVSRQIFDETVTFQGPSVALADIVERISGLEPDIVFYPSVGMATWWVVLSNVRLAPIQVATVGHPATTQSEVMDYVVVDGSWPGDPSCFSETVVVTEPGSTAFIMRDDADFPEPDIRRSPEVLRIAVPSMACKLNAPFLALCRSLFQKSQRKLEFCFFPNMIGLTAWHMEREIRKWLPSAIVYPRADYNQYLRNLTGCDLHLSTFPFGGTNSNIDSMRLGIPMVSLEGLEVHAQTDAGMMRRIGMPEWLIAYHPAEFERACLRLIHNDDERVAIAQQLTRTDIFDVFMHQSKASAPDEFVRAMDFIYRRHEDIQASGVRYWKPENWHAAFHGPLTQAAG